MGCEPFHLGKEKKKDRLDDDDDVSQSVLLFRGELTLHFSTKEDV